MIHCDSCILAVDAGGTSLKAALVPEDFQAGMDVELLNRTFFSVPVSSEGTREEILAAYETLGRKAAVLAAERSLSIIHIAVCTPGPFDYQEGCSLMKHKYQAAYGISLRPSLQKGAGTDCPVTFLHDSTAFLLGVKLAGLTERERFCGVIIGTGLGFAAMADGMVLENPSGGPAISIFSRPYLDGTSEDYVSKRGILGRYIKELQSSGTPLPSCLPSVADIAYRAGQGEWAALKTFEDTGFHLGQILAPVLREHAFDTVVLGGAISKSAHLFLPRFQEVLQDVNTILLTAGSIDHAPLLGCTGYRSSFRPREFPYSIP